MRHGYCSVSRSIDNHIDAVSSERCRPDNLAEMMRTLCTRVYPCQRIDLHASRPRVQQQSGAGSVQSIHERLKDTKRSVTSCFASLRCCLDGFSGYCAASVCSSVQVARPSSSRLTGPLADEVAMALRSVTVDCVNPSPALRSVLYPISGTRGGAEDEDGGETIFCQARLPPSACRLLLMRRWCGPGMRERTSVRSCRPACRGLPMARGSRAGG